MVNGGIHKHSSNGIALIAVLWVVAVMGTITLLYSRQTNLSLKINRNVMKTSQAMMLAEAGVHYAIGELMLDAETNGYDSRNDTWFDNQSLFYDVSLGEGVFRLVHADLEEVNAEHYGIMDESAKLNINVATKQQLMQLEFAEEDVVEAILDWRDENDDQRPLGAENMYYNGLSEPYNAKNGKFDSLDELLLVKGMTVDILYGEDVNQNGTLDVPENDGADNFPNDNSDGKLRRGWRPYLTFYSYEENVDLEGNSRINLNDADKEAMQSQLGEVLDETDIDSIIAARDENNFESIGDLFDVQLTVQTSSGNNGRGGGNNQNQETLDSGKIKQILDQVTVSGEDKLWGRININTAPKTVLQCLLPENPDAVEGIIEYRESGEQAFDSLADLLEVDGIDEDTFKDLVNDISIKSSVFSVRSIGYLQQSQAYKEVSALIDRGENLPQIRYWKVIR